MSLPQTRGAPPGRRVVVRVARQAVLLILFLAAALLGTLSGVLFAYTDDLPQISALDSYQPSTITTLLARDGRVIGEFAVERRLVIGYDDIAPVLRQAILASEDADFEQHFGLSVSRIFITAIKDVFYRQRAGASTITQQVAKNLFLWSGRSFFRKGLEAYFTVLLELCWGKQRILEVYLNIVELGDRVFGVQAAAETYFQTSARQLTPSQAALLAVVLPSPLRYSAWRPSGYVRDRQHWVLRQMGMLGGSAYLEDL